MFTVYCKSLCFTAWCPWQSCCSNTRPIKHWKKSLNFAWLNLFFFSGCWPRASARGNRSHGNRGPIKASRCSSTLEGWLSRADSSSLWRHSAAVIEKLASGGWSIGAQFKYLYSGNDRKLKRAHRDQKYTWKKIGLFIRARTKARKCFFQLGKTKLKFFFLGSNVMMDDCLL